MSGFVDFADVKARCSIVDAVALLGLKTTEERNQLRAPCPACGNGGPRAIVITPSKGLFHCFPSKAGGDQIALVSHVKNLSQKDAATLMLGQSSPGTVRSTSPVPATGTSTVQDKFPPLDYLEADHITVEALGLSQETAEALGIGYAPKGMMKGYVAIPIRLPTGELTGYIGVTEARVPKEFHLSNVVTFPQEDGLGCLAPRKCGVFFFCRSSQLALL
jgi:DNA primase